MRKTLVATCLAALPSLASADQAADFQRLVETFPSLSFGVSLETQLDQARTFVAGMTGTWVFLGPFLADSKTFPEPEMLAKACETLAFTATATGAFGFDLSQPGRSKPFAIHLQWIGGTTYTARYDEAGLLDRMFGDRVEAAAPDMLFDALTRTPWTGPLSLLPAGPDLIYLQAPQAAADLLARCPA